MVMLVVPPNDISYLSIKLRSLDWLGYPLKALPSNFIPKNLVELILICSNIEKLWEENMYAPKLKCIILKDCPHLIKVLDLLDAPLLEEIDIQYCARLLGLSSRNHFPSLRYLHLFRCISLTKISDLLDASLIEKIDIDGCISLLGFPSVAHPFDNLRELNMRNCYNLQSFPNNIRFPSLVSLDLSYCTKLTRISDLLDAPLVEQINLYYCKSLLEFPPPVHHFNKLRNLKLGNCKNLQSFPNNIHFPSLVSLDLSRCITLARISDFLDAPLLERVNLKNCSSLLYFPAPFQHFNNLWHLHLQDCKNLRSFPSTNIHFPSLTSLDFHGCIKLTKFPHISGNITSLYMRMTEIDEVPSSIKNLPELVALDLAECTRLKHISISICELKALRELNLRNCSALECFPEILDTMRSLKILDLSGTPIKGLHHSIENLSRLHILCLRKCENLDEVPSSMENLTQLVKLDLAECTRLKHFLISISKLKALRELNLSNCYALECFPEILDTMESLKILDLSGTAIKGLHHSIENLSGLDMLFLRECKNLEMLPISIYNLTSLNILELTCCSKLENLPGNSVTNLSNHEDSTTAKPPICRLSECYLYFTNCLNLNKTAVINFMELQINQHRDMATKGSGTQAVDLKFFYLGNEVPGWFKGQTNGSLINIQMSGHDSVNGHLIGFAACAVIEFYDDEDYVDIDIRYRHFCHCKDDGSPWNDSIIVPYEDKTLIDSDHIALWYSDASVLELCGECTNYLFEFDLEGCPNCKVKCCGVCPIYEKHNVTLLSIANETCGAAD